MPLWRVCRGTGWFRFHVLQRIQPAFGALFSCLTLRRELAYRPWETENPEEENYT